jgi:hypothetical protein
MTYTKEPVGNRPPVSRKSPHGGIEPGSLHGSRVLPSSEGSNDSADEALLAKVNKMTGREMRRWLKIAGNERALNDALARRNQ